MEELACDFSFGEDQDAIRDSEHFRKLRRYKEDGYALLREPVHDFKDFCFSADVDAASRLIQKQDLRLSQQAFGHHYFLLVAATKRSDRVLRSARFNGEVAHHDSDIFLFPALRKPERGYKSLET